MRNALIVNAYVVGNWGDAAIVEGIIQSVRQAGFERVTVAPTDWQHGADTWRALGADDVVCPLVSLADGPARLRALRPARLAASLWRYARFRSRLRSDPTMAAYRAADLILGAGGGYLGGARAGGNLVKVVNVRGAADVGRPSVVAPVTVNPVSPSVGRILAWGLAGSRVFTRDLPSHDILAGLGVPSRVVPDIALRAPSLRAAVPRTSAGTRSGLRLGWAPRGYRTDHRAWGDPAAAERTVGRALRESLADPDGSLLLVAHVRASAEDDDRVAVERVRHTLPETAPARVTIADDPHDLGAAVDRYRDLDVLITSRMHAAIFAMAVGTPALAIAYEPKVAGVMADLGLSDRVLPADASLTPQHVLDAIARVRSPEERMRTRAAFDAAQGRFGPFDEALAAASGHDAGVRAPGPPVGRHR